MNVNGCSMQKWFNGSVATNRQPTPLLNTTLLQGSEKSIPKNMAENKTTFMQSAKFFFKKLFLSCNPRTQTEDATLPVVEEQRDTVASLDSNLPMEMYQSDGYMKRSQSIPIYNLRTQTERNFTSSYSPTNGPSESYSPFTPHSFDSKEEIIKKYL